MADLATEEGKRECRNRGSPQTSSVSDMFPRIAESQERSYEEELSTKDGFQSSSGKVEPAGISRRRRVSPTRLDMQIVLLRALFIILTVGLCTIVGAVASRFVVVETVAMIYLLGVVLVGSRFGGRAGFFACLASIPAFDLFIAEPHYQLGPLDRDLPFTYAVMFLIALFMNHLTGQIHALKESLEQKVIQRTENLKDEIRRREDTEKELISAVETLLKSNMTLENFGKLASHDLQEPLRTILGFAALLKKKYAGTLDEAGQHFIDIIIETSEMAGDTIDDLLNHARLRAEQNEFDWVDLNHTFDQAVDCLLISISDSGAVIQRGDLPWVWGNASLLRHVFQNLISNAIKYTDKNPPLLRISASRDQGFTEISVTDNGIGLSDCYRERIFEPFFRIHTSTTTEGTGLGLAICRTIVELHGGKIFAEPRTDEGTTVKFTIPDKQAEQAENLEVDHEQSH